MFSPTSLHLKTKQQTADREGTAAPGNASSIGRGGLDTNLRK